MMASREDAMCAVPVGLPSSFSISSVVSLTFRKTSARDRLSRSKMVVARNGGTETLLRSVTFARSGVAVSSLLVVVISFRVDQVDGVTSLVVRMEVSL